ncbi:TPA: nucleotidyltransferase domain-containing protein [Campylobacter fetus subsp. venerealis]|uniref:Nucleotidyltransferase domain-containing protein n=1 Tax=Campylobacter fetus subsp. venerealis NCTC 10354 TaxID=983328 RepID=A0AAE6J0C1_CAMFE|nr:nucleotidyltransferase domain-containing protein [Campylobacter fetus]OCS21818.1 nucleotidyltransferase [Campylobacter fetus subsp. venerealis cfvi97/532]OCS25369.1 nucleotidyltransferase [Campylobacter fetus subsp. venerealis cfvB10]OCS29301.1 nucleotidyltransferase [Campylobacter fetus subsp. venerealis LMG 6570 = CCUG 33900]OCS42019.1 nucleotidyltransferase [Campylobacter fetus subsp. venerealis cfvi02/298]AHE95048.1 nucleotidyl transferase domain protein [Campylobacter fetus subsp. vene
MSSSVLAQKDILSYLSELKPSLQKDGIKEIGLFGSYAKGYADENSDIDIVVLADKKSFLDRLNAFKALEYLSDLKEKITNKFHKSVDICDFYSEEKMKNNKIVKGAIYV